MKNSKLIPYTVILAAKQGDPDAMRQIFQHYDRYINFCSQRILSDEYGNQFLLVADEIKSRIQAKLMYQIIYDFDPYKLPDGETLENNASQIETHFDTAAIRPKPTVPGGPVRAGDSPSICYNIRQTPLYLENCMTSQTGYAFPEKCAFARQGEQYAAK